MRMRRIILTAAAAAMMTVGGASMALAAPGNNWGQEVKECNQTNCYPGGTNRGAYVSNQAQDDQGPGYGHEIHDAANPGNSDPQSDNF